MKNMKIGSGTLSLGLIALGVLLLLQASGLVSYQALKYFGPVLLIVFGIEVIWGYFRQSDSNQGKMRFSVWAVILLVVVFIFSSIESVFPYSSVWQPKHLSPVNAQIEVSSAIKKVNIQIPDGKINIIGISGQNLSYSGELKATASSQEKADQIIREHWKVREVGDTLEMVLELPMQFSLIDFSFKSGYLDIRVPQALVTHVKTKNGKIDVEQMNNDIILNTSNGKITADTIQGNLEIKTSNGAITASDIDGNLQATTSNGSVTLSDISGTITAKSSNGALSASSAVNGPWKLTTSNGKITLNLPQKTDANIQAATSNGKFNGDIAWSGDEKKKRSSMLGNGDHPIHLKTSNGSIVVNQR